jgi:hypothetical protein
MPLISTVDGVVPRACNPPPLLAPGVEARAPGPTVSEGAPEGTHSLQQKLQSLGDEMEGEVVAHNGHVQLSSHVLVMPRTPGDC